MVWQPNARAPRNLEELARFVDENFAELSRSLATFQVFPEVYTPTWTHTNSTDPVIGNGTLIGHAARWGGMAIAQIRLAIGSTTTFEATPSPGNWQFGVPWACEGEFGPYVGAALILDVGSVRYAAATRIGLGDAAFTVTPDNNANFLRNNVPMTWTTNDTLTASIMYPVRD